MPQGNPWMVPFPLIPPAARGSGTVGRGQLRWINRRTGRLGLFWAEGPVVAIPALIGHIG